VENVDGEAAQGRQVCARSAKTAGVARIRIARTGSIERAAGAMKGNGGTVRGGESRCCPPPATRR